MNVQPIPEGGFDALGRRKINEIIRAIQALEIRDHPDVEIDRTSRGTFIRPKNTGDSSNNNTAPRWG